MSDIHTVAADSLKVLAPKRPIREADIPSVFRRTASDATDAGIEACYRIRWPEPIARSERHKRRAVSGVAETLK